MQPPPDWQFNDDITPLESMSITMQKQLEGTQKYINEVIEVAQIRWANPAIT